MAEQLPSKKQHELLEYIEAFIKSNGYGPSYREIMRALDYKSVSTVAVHVDGLIKRGYLNKRDRSARSLEVVGAPLSSGKLVEKNGDNSYKWLVGKVRQLIDAYAQSRSPDSLHQIQIVMEALVILELHDVYAASQARLVKLEK